MDDAYIFDGSLHKNTVYVNEQVTTHIIMPENIKLVDISTNSIIGNQCPVVGCKTSRKTTNHTALTGSASRIRNAPKPPPSHAPKIGTNAVTATNVETAPAYGMPSINMPTKQSTPMMIASVNWPLTKFVKVWFVSDANSYCSGQKLNIDGAGQATFR